MKCENARIIEQTFLTENVCRLVLKTSIAAEADCGQFVMAEVPGLFLRRPISVCTADGDTLVLVYRISGAGTLRMSEMKKGETLSLFGPLGNGFPAEDRDVLLLGGGIGVPPLLEAAKRFRASGRRATAVLGFADSASVILTEEFKALGCDVYTATLDGSCGTGGTVLDAVDANGIRDSFVLACGPKAMLKAVSERYREGYISLEERMACGIGACMGCVVKDTEGNALRVCKDGPVFPIGKAVL